MLSITIPKQVMTIQIQEPNSFWQLFSFVMNKI